MLVEAVTKKGIVKEAADNFGVEPEEIDFLYNNGKGVEKNFSMRGYKKRINAASIIHSRDRLFIILKIEKKKVSATYFIDIFFSSLRIGFEHDLTHQP